MVARPEPPPLDDGGDRAELSLVLQVAQAALAHEFQVAERLDAKARTLLTGAAAWFAVVVGITGAVLTRENGPARPYVLAIFSLAIVAVAFLIMTGIYVFRVWALQQEEELAPRALLEMAAAARDPDDDLASKLVDSYASLLASKRRTNKTRADAFRKATAWSAGAFLAAAAQLIAVVVASVFG